MNVTPDGSGALSPVDLSVPGSRIIVFGYWIATLLFCLQIGFTAYAQLGLPQVAEMFAHLGFPDYFRVELSLAKILGVAVLLAPVPARLKEWAYAGFAITLGSALIATSRLEMGRRRGAGRPGPSCSGGCLTSCGGKWKRRIAARTDAHE